jgi:predicted Zn-dependent protease
MKSLLIVMLVFAPGICGAQGLLDFRTDLAFETQTVEALAERTYRVRLRALAADGRLDTNPRLLGRLHQLVAQLLAGVRIERPDAATLAWEIHTCRRCGENASAMAGGKLLISEEFIATYSFTDDELAYVLAHEMAHVLAEHTREFATAARFFVGNGRHRDYEDIQNELDESLALVLRMSPVYIQQELEADYMGFIIGARSGFDPKAMLRMLAKLDMRTGPSFAPHPPSGERSQRAEAMLQAARRINEAAGFGF